MDFDKITEALKTITPEQARSIIMELAQVMAQTSLEQIGAPQDVQPLPAPQQPQQIPQQHPTQTPNAIVRQQMMRQPMGMLNRGY